MGSELAQNPISSANASGFPLQMATVSAINKSDHWRVVVEEHPWRTEGRSQGYIDIIARNRQRNPSLDYLVIECKRVRQTGWVFLVPKELSSDRRQARLWNSKLANMVWQKYDWDNLPSDPTSYQSVYCAIPGQDQGRMNLLERTASELIDSVEALAAQEKEQQDREGATEFSRSYVPIIVTTAKLFVACFDPSSISLTDGELPKETSTEEIPYIRFFKGLGTCKEHAKGKNIQELYRWNQRTVFIVNAEKLPSFLGELEVGGWQPS